jgi:HTH-type transcriptional regulator/antitoxin HigA
MRAYRIIRTPEQYNEYSNIQSELVFSGKTDPEITEELELLAMLTERYISEKYQWQELDPIPFLCYLMQEHKLDNIGLSSILGIKFGHFEDIMNYRRGLSIPIILKLSEKFRLDPKVFNKPYKLESEYNQYLEDASVMNTVKDLNKTETYYWWQSSPTRLSFIDHLMLRAWESSFNTNKKVRRVIHFLLKIPPKSYLKTNGYLNEGFIYKHETALKVFQSESFKKLKVDLEQRRANDQNSVTDSTNERG